MRKIILGVAVTLDGFIEGPKGEYDWCLTDQDYGMGAFFRSIDAIFMGRKSYELTKTMKSSQNPWEGVLTYVFSNSMKETDDKEVRLVSGDIRKEVLEIRNLKGKNIWLFGGAELTTAFINADLIDEFWLAVHPILLGSGKPLFQQINGRKKLKLIEQKSYSTGLVSLRYQPDLHNT